MLGSPFKIYNASAGSGKTYALSKAYLKIVLSAPNSFKRILAITFTNKAVNEMKNRILDSLYQFSTTDREQNLSPLFHELSKELKLTTEALRNLSKLRLKEILHNYAFFDISTIDKFTHRLIRTFAKDLKLPQNFEVVLDRDLLLDEAVGRVIAKAGEDMKLTRILMDFALEKIDDDRSWDIGYDLLKIGQLLFDEANLTHIQHLEDKNLEDFLKLQKLLQKNIKSSQENATAIAKETLLFIEQTGLDNTDFPRETLPNHFKKVKDGVFAPSVLYSNKLEENLRAGKIVKANVEQPAPEIASELLQRYIHLKEQVYNIGYLSNAYRNLVPLTLLNEIRKELKAVQLEKDQLSISEFNTIISKEIKTQPAPFIYERLGEKYRHYFIDEFQDTSEMQWQNLIPLISNALEGADEQGKQGSLFLVGDAKQAIYRWRGGKAEQFLELMTEKVQPFSIKGDQRQLPKNYRSQNEIINFNNLFFQNASAFLDDPIYQELFVKGNQQETNDKEGGHVKLTFLEEETEEDYGQKTLETIENVLLKGYDYKDICILTRKKKHGVALSNFLMNKGIPIISSESLLLSNSPHIQFLVNLLRFMLYPEAEEIKYEILRFLYGEKEDAHTLIHKRLPFVEEVLQNEYGFNVQKFQEEALYDGLEIAIKAFDLAKTSSAYITAFMDLVWELGQKQNPDAQSFLNYWEKKNRTLSISTPDNINAVQVMTVHKSKGLEFPIVIYPYANTYILEEINPKLWVPVKAESFSGFKELLINKKKEVAEYGTLAAALYYEEEHKLQLDAFNLLYVALTRAIAGLYIITARDLKRDGSYKTENYSGLFIHHLNHLNKWNPETLDYEFGTLSAKNEKIITADVNLDIPYINTQKNRSSFKILTKAGMLWEAGKTKAIEKGNIIHAILGEIRYAEDVDNAIEKAMIKGIIQKEEKLLVKTDILTLVNHPQLKKFYSDAYTVWNEREILLNNNTSLRPDRVAIKENKIHIIDYKTGSRNIKYSDQLESYAKAYIDLGFEVADKIIVYISDEIKIEHI
ncbi:UvrD-helicase domain-containing protein [Maribacter sp. 2210JD10-5]|uniref:UvrD-helicase domain-containing protein n=1 Tax=Maribacter sp. 2210JD10-5 TaxID=3386272 RepID=UPI0039BD22AF